MKEGKTFQHREIRVIKIGRKAILNLTWEILSQIIYEKFRLPHGGNIMKRICIDWYFDEEPCEITLLAHSAADVINQEAVIRYIQNTSVEVLDSVLLSTDGKDCYRSISSSSFVTKCPIAAPTKNGRWAPCNLCGTLCAILRGRIRLLRKHEIRVIRLSKKAIQELLWEHFMAIGDDVMEILEEDSASVIFGMHAVGKLEELTLYAINLNEVSDAVFDEVNAYCDQNIGFTTDSLSANPEDGPLYVSVIRS